ncbi:MAG TPA: GDP-mannose 4,6-dehydratase [Chloroflexota bacterium]|nr:GDP-mannose 4,6-dehydratase [Chloroflexota bacterium]
MRVLITGAAGFVGRHLAAHLFAEGGHEIWGLTRARRVIEGLDSRMRLVVADLREKESVDEAVQRVRPQAVYHLASQASVARSLADPLDTILNNVVGQVNLLEACARHAPEARILVVGSNEEYGLTRPDELPISEAKELRPISPYAVSKVTQDLLGHQYFATRGLQVIRVRPFTHTGPGQANLFVTPAFARQLAEMERGQREHRMRVGFLDGQRDFTDVRDVVRGYRLLIERGEPGDVYNLGAGVPRSVRSILDGLLELTTVRPVVEIDPSMIRPLEMPVMYADCSKIYAATGWKTEIPFEQTLRDVLDDWRQRVCDVPSSSTV